MSKQYMGWRSESGCHVLTSDEEAGLAYHLPPRNDLRNHSPTGFEWGYGGSGPAQLALALCADALDDDDAAQGVYQRVKELVVSRIKTDRWILPAEELYQAIGQAIAEKGGVK